MVVEAAGPPQKVPLRGVGVPPTGWGAAAGTHGRRGDAGQLTPQPSRRRCRTKEADHVRRPGPPPAPTSGARTRPAAGCRWRRGAGAGSTSPPTRRWPARPAAYSRPSTVVTGPAPPWRCPLWWWTGAGAPRSVHRPAARTWTSSSAEDDAYRRPAPAARSVTDGCPDVR